MALLCVFVFLLLNVEVVSPCRPTVSHVEVVSPCHPTISPPMKVNKPPSITCYKPKYDSYTTPPKKTKVVVRWRTPDASDPEDGTIKVTRTNEKNPGSEFDVGNHVINYKTQDHSGLQAKCSVSFHVEVVRCKYLPFPYKGYMRCDAGDLYGSTCKFSCYVGHEITGSRERTCQHNGEYDGSQTTCKPKRCRELVLPDNGERFICTNNNYYKSVCYLKCKRSQGYAATRGEFTVCSEGTTWTNPILRCEDIQEPTFENCPNSTIIKPLEKNHTEVVVKWPGLIVKDNSGKHKPIELMMGQPSGSAFKKGITTIWYNVKDYNGNRGDPCVFAVQVVVVECPVPDFHDDYLHIKGACPAPFTLKKTCQLACRFDIQLKAAISYIRCENKGDGSTEGYWDWGQGTGKNMNTSAHRPFCNVRTCPSLRPPDNGAVACDRWVGGKFCNLQCNTGFDIPAWSDFVKVYICPEKSGKWTPNSLTPNCTEVFDPEELTMTHKFYYYEGECSKIETQKQIKENFMKALQNSLWSMICNKDCRAENVDVVCGKIVKRSSPRGRPRRFKIKISFNTVIKVKKSNNRTVMQTIARLQKRSTVLQQGVKYWSRKTDVAGQGIQPQVKSFSLMPICRPGTLRGKFTKLACVECPRGTFYYTKRGDCMACPRGQYQENLGQLDCKTCPPGQTTLTLQSFTKSECFDYCPAGHYSPNGVVPCSPCPRGKYQPDVNSKHCLLCPVGKTTIESGSALYSNCIGHDIMLEGYLEEELIAKSPSDINDFSFVTWIKVGYESKGGVTFLVRDPFRRNSLSIKISDRVIVTVKNTTSSVYPGLMSTEKWYHIGVVYKMNTLTIYQNGAEVNRHFISSAGPTIPRGSIMRVTLDYYSVIFMRGMQLLPFGLVTKEMTKLNKSCDVTVAKTATFAYHHLKSDTSPRINELAPSTCTNDDPCKSKPCGEHVCTARYNGPKCYCLNDYTGPKCSHPPNSCHASTCQNNGTCTETKTSHICNCVRGYTGTHCEDEIVDGGWSSWTGWSGCSVTCGNGIKLRKRDCNSPLPDPAGKTCSGAERETMSCKEEKCPQCKKSDLVPGNGVVTNCKETSANVSCSISCQPGLIFAQPPPEYFCNEGQWFPSLKTIPCTDSNSPLKLGINYIVTYNVQSNKSASQYLDDVWETFNSVGSNLPCTVAGNCQIDSIAVSDCQVKPQTAECLAQDDDIRGVMTVVTPVPDGNIDLRVIQQLNNPFTDILLDTWSQYESLYGTSHRVRHSHIMIESLRRENLTKQLAVILEKWDMLEQGHVDVETNHYEAFNLDLDGNRSVQPSFLVARQYMKCPSGSVQGSIFCVKCPPGTYFTETGCEICEYGFYQDEPGMEQCKPCNGFSFTSFKGSSSASECVHDENVKGSMAIITDWSTTLHKLNLETMTLKQVKHSSRIIVADYDLVNKQTYFVSDGKLWISKAGGSKDIIFEFGKGFVATGLAGDFSMGLIFYISNNVLGVLRRTLLKTIHRAVIITDLAGDPRDLITDSSHTQLFWVANRNIFTSLYDGTGQRTIYKDHYWVGAVTLDQSEQSLYWSSNNILKRINVDGTGFFPFIKIKSRMLGFTTHYFFFIDNSGDLVRTNKDGSGQTHLMKIGVNSGVMKTYEKPNANKNKSACGRSNGGCSQICLPLPLNKRKCVCAVNSILQLNNITCRHEMSDIFETPITERWIYPGFSGFTLGYQTSLTFSVMACESARLQLSQDSSSRYEIRLGEHHGNVSSIKKCRKSWKQCVRLKETTEIQLSCTEYLTFKVEWRTNDGIILSFLGEDGFQRMLSAKDRDPLNVKFIAIATGKKVTGTWKI